MHLDGSLRLKTLIELAQEIGLELPSYDEAELRAKVFPEEGYSSLEVCSCALVCVFVHATCAAPTPRPSKLSLSRSTGVLAGLPVHDWRHAHSCRTDPCRFRGSRD